MTACAYCRAPDADLLTPNGDSICQRCDTTIRTQMLERRAAAQSWLDPIGAPLTFASPRTLLVVGAVLMGSALVFGVLEAYGAGRIHVLFLGTVFCGGFAAVARGLRGR